MHAARLTFREVILVGTDPLFVEHAVQESARFAWFRQLTQLILEYSSGVWLRFHDKTSERNRVVCSFECFGQSFGGR